MPSMSNLQMHLNQKRKKLHINCFVNSDNDGDRVTRRSQTDILIYFNRASIIFYSKRQNTTERSIFGSKFVALRLASEVIISMRYKLRIFGIKIDGTDIVFFENEAV